MRALIILPSETQGPHTQCIRQGPCAFENSKNALEDVLDLASALAMSRTTITGRSGQLAFIGSKTLEYKRAGTGRSGRRFIYHQACLVLVVILILVMSKKGKKTMLSSAQLWDLASLRIGERSVLGS